MLTTLLLAISVYKFLVRRKKMNIDFVFFDGQLWTYEEWSKIAPLSFFSDVPMDASKFFDPSGYNE
jgi:hypothetical protein